MKTLSVKICETDLSDSDRFLLKEQMRGGQVLGVSEWSEAVLRAVVKRMQSLSLDGLELAEIEIAIKVEGKLFGSGVDGEATVRFQRRVDSVNVPPRP